MSFSFAFEEALDVILCVEESTSGEAATFAFSFAFTFALAAKALLEEAAESSDGFAVEASPGFPGHPVLVEHCFRGFCVSHDGGVRREGCRNGFIAVIRRGSRGRSGIFPIFFLVTVQVDWKGVVLRRSLQKWSLRRAPVALGLAVRPCNEGVTRCKRRWEKGVPL